MRNLACVVTGEDELVWTGSHSLTGRSQSQPHSYIDSLCSCCWNSILSCSVGIFRLIGNPLFCRCETILQPGLICTIRIERIEQRQGTGTRSFILWWRIMWCTNATTVHILNKKEELLKAWRKYAHPSPRRLLNQKSANSEEGTSSKDEIIKIHENTLPAINMCGYFHHEQSSNSICES